MNRNTRITIQDDGTERWLSYSYYRFERRNGPIEIDEEGYDTFSYITKKRPYGPIEIDRLGREYEGDYAEFF